MLDSTEPYLHVAASGTASGIDRRGAMPAGPPAALAPPLLRVAVRELRALDLERRTSLFATSGTGLADVPARDHGDAGLEPDRRTGLLAQLRAATTLQVRALHRAGEPPERVIAHVKQTLHAALAQEGWSDPAAVEGLVRRVVRWSIVAYYDG